MLESGPEKLNLKIQKVKDLKPEKSQKGDMLIVKTVTKDGRDSEQMGSRQNSLLSNFDQTDYRRPSLAAGGPLASLPLDPASEEKRTDGTDA